MGELVKALEHVEKRPGMYFQINSENYSLGLLEGFIVGFQYARGLERTGEGELKFFSEWVATHYGVVQEGRGLFRLIREHVNHDERKGWDEFFKVLPKYLSARKEIGDEGILVRFDEAQNRLLGKGI